MCCPFLYAKKSCSLAINVDIHDFHERETTVQKPYKIPLLGNSRNPRGLEYIPPIFSQHVVQGTVTYAGQ